MIKTGARKIIHVDMDCFYAAIEIRDNPSLAGKPVAVGGSSERGVVCTCNYVAREFGVRSAMGIKQAIRLCPDLISIPVNMAKYRDAAATIRDIFRQYTPHIEPLSLDEAYLDVSDSDYCQGSATLIANEIREKIFQTIGITASAGIAPNKFLAKIASGWNKPNGIYVIRPQDIERFITPLPVQKLFGVGKVTTQKLHKLGLKTCSDIQKLSSLTLTQQFGKFGQQLYDQSRGIDNRPVEAHRVRKSLSIENTFHADIPLIASEYCKIVDELYPKLLHRIRESASELLIKNQYVKIKYSNFKTQTIETMSNEPNLAGYKALLEKIAHNKQASIRLLGLGVHFKHDETPCQFIQQSLFT